ncbi:MAG: hypothetical protein KJZ86_17370 [Caldilineaceae bacterium]|nr:hypothetical protein [Caldilineaceae bacterium]
MPQYTLPISPSPDISAACQRFVADVGEWTRACIQRYADAPPTNVHDQATYTSGWEPYLRATGDEDVLAFLTDVRDGLRDHFTAGGQWRHGYWAMQEAHHGTEHFEIFLGFLQRILPGDPATGRQLNDVAEHMGNWSADVPGWFDWERRRFHSLFFGADGVGTEPGMGINSPDHLRCVNICLLAEGGSTRRARHKEEAPVQPSQPTPPHSREGTGSTPPPLWGRLGGGAQLQEEEREEERQRYLNFATLYAGEWANAILAEERLPLALTPESILYEFDGENEAVYRSFMGEVSGLQSGVDRAENFLGSDAINTFLRLWKETGQTRFRAATERLLDLLVTQLTDPDAGAAAAGVRAYRRWTGGSRYDESVRAALAGLEPFAAEMLTLDTDFRLDHRPSGVGKRSDMPRWLEDGRPRRHNPITLLVAAEINGDEALAVRAVDLARTHFLLARQAFPAGREHGCAARTVSAIARGHGRENHAGMTTAVLQPALGW